MRSNTISVFFAGRFQLESYVDDIFGGALSKAVGMNLKNQLIKVGKLTTAVMNTVKCEGPAQSLVVIGHLYNALSRTVSLPPRKQQKYLAKLRSVLSSVLVTSKELESLVGYLG